MAILNFGFTKINVEKHQKKTDQVNIKSGMNILSVNESEMIEGTKQKAFNIKFNFKVEYEPGLGHIEFEGDLIWLAKEEDAKAISESWNKNKSLPKDVALKSFNKILQNCNVEALILSRVMNLPSPIQLPKVKPVAQPAAK